MRLANPAGLWLALLALPIVALHILRPRRLRLEVASVYLWRTHAAPVAAATPWQRLRPSVLLALQLLAALGLAIAVARPVSVRDAELAEHTVFILDASGSMGALDGDPTRFDDAVTRARELRGDLPPGGTASVVVAGAAPRVVLTASPDGDAFDSAVGPLEPGAGAADFAAAFTLAESLEAPGQDIGFVLLSDGGLSADERRLIPPGTRYERIGSDGENRSVDSLVTEARGSDLHVVVTVTNHGDGRVEQPVRIDVDAVTQSEGTLSIGAGQTAAFEADVPAGDRIEAWLDGGDLQPGDDRGVAVVGRRRDLAVTLAGPDNAFLDDLFAVIPGTTVNRVRSTAEATAAGAPAADLYVFDRVAVPVDIGAPFIAIVPPGGAADVTVTGTVERPVITLVDSTDAVLADVDLTQVDIAVAQRVDPGGGRVLVGAEGGPLLVRGVSGAEPFAYLAFALSDSNLAVQIAYPILFDRLVTELTAATLPSTELRVGDAVPVDPSQDTTVSSPDGRDRVLRPGESAPRADRVGFWVVSAGDATTTVAVNPVAGESAIEPVESLPIGPRPDRPGGDAPDTETPRLRWVIAPLLAIVVAEWWWARRRVGVSRRQWRAAEVLRAAVAALLLVAFIGPTIHRQAGDVATVFLIDASDSVAGPARADALEWVQDALANQPPGVRSAVAVFGGDARLELTLGSDNVLGTPSVRIDPTRTNLATALRLAAAVLPDDARRRVVLLSDGRATSGDVQAEADDLADRGVTVDVVVLDRGTLDDAAVHSIDAPSFVREGELVTISAVVESGRSTPVRVVLRENGSDVDAQVIQAEPGANEVSFEREAGAGGLVRYDIVAEASSDAIPENDRAYTAVQVEGPARVLLVEGGPGDATTLAAALEGGGLLTETVASSDLPPLDELGSFASIVLVDVDEISLSDQHVIDLTRAVQDLGRGLVTIGGDHSYGIGGYYQSELEELLPVVSEILDPQRRQTVAEVLAIDTSGSMGACHCGAGLSEGGVNKTDITRAAAAQAIEALSASDEVGVLGWNTRYRWALDLQPVPSDAVVDDALSSLFPSGGTDIDAVLTTSATALRGSSASLKHIILLTDGFTDQSDLGRLVDQAESLAAEGITVSVVGTGEGAADTLEEIADAGNGRFYPGRDLQEIPEILQEEAMIASRDFVNEGQFFPEITSSSPVTEDLASSPPLLGYIATTAKPLATTALRIGPDRDPLLASWQTGLGRVTSWTSDGGARWSQAWADWDGAVDFWTRVVSDTIPTSGDGTVSATIIDGALRVTVDSAEPFPDGSEAVARVSAPDGTTFEVALRRLSATSYGAELSVEGAGTFAVGASVTGPGGTIASGAALPSVSYAEEYLPGPSDRDTLEAIAATTAGRVDPAATDAFVPDGLTAGERRVDLARWLLLAAALLWPLAVAVSRLNLRASVVAYQAGRLADWVRARLPTRPGSPRPARPPRQRPEPPPEETAPSETLGRLLDRKRGRAS